MCFESLALLPGLVELKKDPGSLGCTTRRPTLVSVPSNVKNKIRNRVQLIKELGSMRNSQKIDNNNN